MYDLIWQGRLKYGKQWSEQFSLMFFMFYDAGQAAAMANATTELDFWHMINYGVDHFKRGTERRHFRGAKARDAVAKLQHMGSPGNIWEKMWAPTYTGLMRNIETHFQGCQIGPYFAWKAMDLLDRCLGMKVGLTLEEAVKYMPDEPRKCAQVLLPNVDLKAVLTTVKESIEHLDAPGAPGKRCGYAEAETVLCMIKGFFITKVHTIGDDVEEKFHQLKDHPYLRDLLPQMRDWSEYAKAMDAA